MAIRALARFTLNAAASTTAAVLARRNGLQRADRRRRHILCQLFVGGWAHEVIKEVHWHWEDNGGVMLSGNTAKRLKVTELKGKKHINFSTNY